MTTRQKGIITSFLFMIIVGGSVWFFTINLSKNDLAQSEETKNSCVIEEKERTVRGNSLAGLVEDGETIGALFGYYDCNEINRGDLVLYSFAGGEELLAKIVKGIEGDRFELSETGDNYHLLINGEILENSKGEPYLLDERRFNMLSLFVNDYDGIIPEDAYLVIGNLVTGTTDSTRHGLIHRSDILGKAEILRTE